jgi:hypothetical protein
MVPDTLERVPEMMDTPPIQINISIFEYLSRDSSLLFFSCNSIVQPPVSEVI